MYQWYKKNTMKLDRYRQLSPAEQDKFTPIGVFRDDMRPGLEVRYEELRNKLQEQRNG
jgi:2-oxoglutarate ferredoxin oxidoreductase subunit beta